MQFLSPWYIPALAATLTVPPLVIMYFLRLRRRETPVPTTYLWRKVIEDLQVNQPFQKRARISCCCCNCWCWRPRSSRWPSRSVRSR